MQLWSQNGRPKTAGSALAPSQHLPWSSSLPADARPSVSAGQPRDKRHTHLTPRPPRTPSAYDGPARIVSNPRHDPTAPSQISRGSMIRMGAPGTPELSAKIPRKSRDALVIAASPHSPDGESEHQSRAQSSSVDVLGTMFTIGGYRAESVDINRRLRHELAAANRLANELSVKNNELVLERDKYHKLYENALRQLEEVKTQTARSESGSQMLKREDITVEKFFELAAKQSLEGPRKGFMTLGNQFLRGGSGMQGTVQLTLNSLGSPRQDHKRPHTAGTFKFQRPSTGSPVNHRKESGIAGATKLQRPSTGTASCGKESGIAAVPNPRFWGTGIVEDYTLEDLRDALSEIGSKGEDHFPRTGRELDGLKARQELMDERKHHQQIWSRGLQMLQEFFGHELDPCMLPEQILRVFEERLPRKLHGDTCIIYLLNQKTNFLTCTSKNSRRHLQFPSSTGIAGKVQELRRTVTATELNHLEGEGWMDLNISLEAERVSAIASPCFDDHKRMLAVVEVSSEGRTQQFTRNEKRLLELACVLLVGVMGRTEVAADLAKNTSVMETTIECVQNLANPNIVEQTNQIADKCRGLIQANTSRVWLLDRKLDELFVSTENEDDVQSCSVGIGNVGGVVHSRLTEVRSKGSMAVMCSPIIDRNNEVLGVAEMIGKVPSRLSGWGAGGETLETFSKGDENILAAFCAILANYLEHTQYVQRMRSTLKNIQHSGEEALEAITASNSIRDSMREMFKSNAAAMATMRPRPSRFIT